MKFSYSALAALIPTVVFAQSTLPNDRSADRTQQNAQAKSVAALSENRQAVPQAAGKPEAGNVYSCIVTERYIYVFPQN